ncbi:hypothetical protein VOI54_17510 [Tamlana sp. 2201CG12-4]|uniref:hypothetical protein n=1 Tax=Tamlana sp. 2201CG12-4 TaxID=3112582 RepID=UPI002DBB8D0D|nr:hypothetical protein [Tamlana sp. 2201CG12-4]MEC3908829.1 hypothetical protein [Tamlana sp. 2201CG12-4]
MKKKKWRPLMIVMLSLLTFLSCEDKDEGLINPNVDKERLLSIHGLDFELEGGAIFQLDNSFSVKHKEIMVINEYIYEEELIKDTIFGVEADSDPVTTSAFAVSLYGKDIHHSYDVGKTLGRGPAITFRLYSDSYDQLKEGEYKFSDSKEMGTFDANSSTYYDFVPDGVDNDPVVANSIAEGTMSIVSNGGGYIIEWDCLTSSGSVVKGKYVGELEGSFDYRLPTTIRELEGVQISAILDTTYAYFYGRGPIKGWDSSTPGLFKTSKGSALTAWAANADSPVEKKQTDLMLIYDRHDGRNNIRFTSPMDIRAWLQFGGGQSNLTYTLPIHTKVDNNTTFTEADFDNLNEATDFNFTVEDDESWIDLETVTFPKIVTFFTGNGLKGAIRINKVVIPYKPAPSVPWAYTTPTRAVIEIDIKYPASPLPIKIR